MRRAALAEIRDLRAGNARRAAGNAGREATLDAARRHRFGPRPYRAGKGRRTEPAADPDPNPAGGHSRGRRPDPPRTTVHDPTDADRAGPRGGTPRDHIGEPAAGHLDYAPGAFFVRRAVNMTCACRRCDSAAVPADRRLTTAGPAEVGPITRVRCGPGQRALAGESKFADHLPLRRPAGMIGRSGVAVARSTRGRRVAAAADLLRPLPARMHRRVRLPRAVHTDDTPWRPGSRAGTAAAAATCGW